MLKSSRKLVYSINYGEFIARHIERYCPQHYEHQGSFKSSELSRIVAKGCNYGYDIMIEIARLRYFHHNQVAEIRDILTEKFDIPISTSEVSEQLLKFIIYLSIVHYNGLDILRAYIKKQGGYILHVDTTCEGDSPKLASSIDSISGIVLYSAKLNGENEQQLVEFLNNIKQMFGVPLAVMSDMSSGIKKAVAQVFEGVNHYICHFHFIKIIGNLLFESENNQLRTKLSQAAIAGKLKQLKRNLNKVFENKNIKIDQYLLDNDAPKEPKLAIKVLAYNLTLWVLDYSSDGNGYGFPFDQSYLLFYYRLKQTFEYVNQVLSLYHYDSEQTKILWKLREIILPIIADKNIISVIKVYQKKVEIFEKLRHALRAAPGQSKQGLRDYGISSSAEELKAIQNAVDEFSRYLDQEITDSKNNNLVKSYRLVKNRIEKYKEMLFSDPIEIEANGEKRVVFVHRTNNILEGHFRILMHNNRRISGKNSIKTRLKTMHPMTPLVQNLKNRAYVKLIFGDEANIIDKFAEVDEEIVKEKMKEFKNKKYSSPRLKKIIRDKNFFKIISNLLSLEVNVSK